MPIHSYGVLKGRPTERRRSTDPQPPGASDKPHYEIRVDGDGDYRIAVNVESDQYPSTLLYYVDEDFHHPLLRALPSLPPGVTPLQRRPGGEALDYIRGNLFDMANMRLLPPTGGGPDGNLNDLLDLHVQRAIAEDGALLYAFGSRWGPEPQRPDTYFRFLPGNGIHDIHMNQGNEGAHQGDDGVWQDGGLILYSAREDRWVGLFLAFQSQCAHTDDATGRCLHQQETGQAPGRRSGHRRHHHGRHAGTPVAAPAREQDRQRTAVPAVQIVAALVEPAAGGAASTVTLINRSAAPVDLHGWSLVDQQERKTPLAATVAAGAPTTVSLPGGGAQLSAEGGLITLLDPGGLKVHGVSYTQADTVEAGWSIVF